jgi:choline kinase
VADVKLMIATHTTGLVTPYYAQALAVTCAHLAAKGINHLPVIIEDSLVDRGRNRLSAYCLEHDFTHLLFIDADIQFRSDDVLRLLSHDKDIVVAAYMKKNERDEFAISFAPSADGLVEECPKTGTLKIERAGTGFMMIKRRVFETMRDRMPETVYTDYSAVTKPKLTNAFFANIVEDGMLWSEDFTFCNRWCALGGEIWLDPTITLSHWGTYMWRGSILDQLDDYAAPELKAAA